MRVSSGPGHIWSAAEQSGWERMKKFSHSEYMDEIGHSLLRHACIVVQRSAVTSSDAV